MTWFGRMMASVIRPLAARYEILGNPSDGTEYWWGNGPAESGIAVTRESALRCTAFWCAVRVLAEGISSLPLITYRRSGDAKSRASDLPIYRLLHDRPNPTMSSIEFRDLMQTWALVGGNAYAEVQRNGRGAPVALWPMDPCKTTPKRSGNTKTFEYRQSDGTATTLGIRDVLHLMGPSLDGYAGVSQVAYFRETVGLSLAAEKFGARFFGAGARPSAVLTSPKAIDKDTKDKIRESYEGEHGGVSRSHRLMILTGGTFDWKPTSIPNDDAQFLETRKFQIADIARIFRVPPHMLGDLDKATFSNIEHQAIEFVSNTLRPWAMRWEQAINATLLDSSENLFVEHLFDGLLRGDTPTRYSAYAIALQNGWFNVDEVRSFENMNPLPNGAGQAYMRQLNLTPVTGQPGPPVQQPVRQQVELAEVRAAWRPVFVDALSRMATKEKNALSRAAGKPGLAEWAATFYPAHAETVQQATASAFDGYGVALGGLPEGYPATCAGMILSEFAPDKFQEPDWPSRRLAALPTWPELTADGWMKRIESAIGVPDVG